MGPLDIVNHLLNFAAPAAALALLLTLFRRLIGAKAAASLPWWRHAAAVFGVGIATLLVGVVVWGRDGKMLTYAALVVACATCQWVLVRGWKA
ncbi:hypothetical protein CLU85_3735 [Acidovorax sp. 69]|uniref:hypothetical protein n=1 Tax=Acidovorax sp. 69 TaxID=2035202 RepID=UPI000C236053|nr:hypothetical protein [Acidovorax sp. 69]PJI98899.1 hypothetical protein CLU85_3735 [Acidovorax sp. 69]